MDYIIYRQTSQEFMRWNGSDSRIFLTGDRYEIEEEARIEKSDGENPIIISLSYSKAGKDKTRTKMKIGRTEVLSFVYDNDEDRDSFPNFYEALDRAAENFVVTR